MTNEIVKSYLSDNQARLRRRKRLSVRQECKKYLIKLLHWSTKFELQRTENYSFFIK